MVNNHIAQVLLTEQPLSYLHISFTIPYKYLRGESSEEHGSQIKQDARHERPIGWRGKSAESSRVSHGREAANPYTGGAAPSQPPSMFPNPHGNRPLGATKDMTQQRPRKNTYQRTMEAFDVPEVYRQPSLYNVFRTPGSSVPSSNSNQQTSYKNSSLLVSGDVELSASGSDTPKKTPTVRGRAKNREKQAEAKARKQIQQSRDSSLPTRLQGPTVARSPHTDQAPSRPLPSAPSDMELVQAESVLPSAGDDELDLSRGSKSCRSAFGSPISDTASVTTVLLDTRAVSKAPLSPETEPVEDTLESRFMTPVIQQKMMNIIATPADRENVDDFDPLESPDATDDNADAPKENVAADDLLQGQLETTGNLVEYSPSGQTTDQGGFGIPKNRAHAKTPVSRNFTPLHINTSSPKPNEEADDSFQTAAESPESTRSLSDVPDSPSPTVLATNSASEDTELTRTEKVSVGNSAPSPICGAPSVEDVLQLPPKPISDSSVVVNQDSSTSATVPVAPPSSNVSKKSETLKPGPKQTESLSPFAKYAQQKKKDKKPKPGKGKGKAKAENDHQQSGSAYLKSVHDQQEDVSVHDSPAQHKAAGEYESGVAVQDHTAAHDKATTGLGDSQPNLQQGQRDIQDHGTTAPSISVLPSSQTTDEEVNEIDAAAKLAAVKPKDGFLKIATARIAVAFGGHLTASNKEPVFKDEIDVNATASSRRAPETPLSSGNAKHADLAQDAFETSLKNSALGLKAEDSCETSPDRVLESDNQEQVPTTLAEATGDDTGHDSAGQPTILPGKSKKPKKKNKNKKKKKIIVQDDTETIGTLKDHTARLFEHDESPNELMSAEGSDAPSASSADRSRFFPLLAGSSSSAIVEAPKNKLSARKKKTAKSRQASGSAIPDVIEGQNTTSKRNEATLTEMPNVSTESYSLTSSQDNKRKIYESKLKLEDMRHDEVMHRLRKEDNQAALQREELRWKQVRALLFARHMQQSYPGLGIQLLGANLE